MEGAGLHLRELRVQLLIDSERVVLRVCVPVVLFHGLLDVTMVCNFISMLDNQDLR